jgi:hypothetical protein
MGTKAMKNFYRLFTAPEWDIVLVARVQIRSGRMGWLLQV